MLKQYSTIFATLMVNAADLENCLYADRLDDPVQPCGSETLERISGLLVLAKKMADELLLDASIPLMERIAAKVSEAYPAEDAYRDISDLRSRVQDQLKSRYFYFVPPARLGYYRDKQLFGQSMEIAFPTALDDIEDAGKCLALGQGTACVMHLMRVMEAGLKALAKELGIPYAPSWEAYLTQIQTKIGLPRKRKSAIWKRNEPFFRDLSGDLMTVKQAWRNPTMHIVRRYPVEEAEEIFRAVRRFMQHLEPRIKGPASSRRA